MTASTKIDDILKILDDVKPGYNGEIQLSDAMNVLASNQSLMAYAFNSKRFDAGDKLGFLIANIEVSKILLWHGLNSLVQWYPLGKNVTVIKDNNEITNLLVQIDKVCKN